jgi:hypothetical protein
MKGICSSCDHFDLDYESHEPGEGFCQKNLRKVYCMDPVCREEKLTQTLKETQEVLKLVEWGSDCIDYEKSCPVCRSNSPNNHCYTGDGTHAETCQLSKLINKINSILEG